MFYIHLKWHLNKGFSMKITTLATAISLASAIVYGSFVGIGTRRGVSPQEINTRILEAHNQRKVIVRCKNSATREDEARRCLQEGVDKLALGMTKQEVCDKQNASNVSIQDVFKAKLGELNKKAARGKKLPQLNAFFPEDWIIKGQIEGLPKTLVEFCSRNLPNTIAIR